MKSPKRFFSEILIFTVIFPCLCPFMETQTVQLKLHQEQTKQMYPRAMMIGTPISFCHLPCSEVRLYTGKQKQQQKRGSDILQYIF